MNAHVAKGTSTAMAQQYLRKLELNVSSSDAALDLSQLEINFQVRQWDIQTPNTATIRVFNPSWETAQRVQKEFSRVVLSAGYQDGPFGVIFDGTLIQVRRGKLSAVDSYMDLHCSDGDAAYCFGIVQTSLAAGSTARDRLTALTKSLAEHGVTEGYVPEDLPEQSLPRGRVMFGMTNGQLRRFAAWSGMKWSIQDRQVQMVPLTGFIPGEAVVLNNQTGLIGIPEQTQDGISARCLLNPTVKMGRRIQLNNSQVNQAQLQASVQGQVQNAFLPLIAADGFYRAITATHTGETRGQAWYTDIVAIALNAGVTPGLAAKGYG